jgi:hypothetical protein
MWLYCLQLSCQFEMKITVSSFQVFILSMHEIFQIDKFIIITYF